MAFKLHHYFTFSGKFSNSWTLKSSNRGQGKTVVVSHVLLKTCRSEICCRCCSRYGKTKISKCTVKIERPTKKARKCCFIQLENPQKWTLLSLLPQFKEYWRSYLLNNSAWSTSENVNATVVFFAWGNDVTWRRNHVTIEIPTWLRVMLEFQYIERGLFEIRAASHLASAIWDSRDARKGQIWNEIVFFGWLSSAVRSFTKIYKRNFEISWNFYEKTGLNADKFATFWMFPESFCRSFVLQITLRSMIGKTQVDLRNFEKRENVWIGLKRNAELVL